MTQKIKKTRKAYEEYLNNLYDFHQCRDLTAHCWAGNDKTTKEKNWALKKGLQCKYGTIIHKLDPICFEVGYKEWRR